VALYRFKVSDPAGRVSETLIEGDSQAEATRRLQRRGLLPLDFLGEGAASVHGRGGFRLRSRFDVVDFTDRLVPLLEAHIPLERALGIVAEGLPAGYAADVANSLRKGLHEGRRFSHMLRDRSHLFPEIYASLVEAGEEAGCLPEVMSDLRRFLNERRELMSYIVSASIYPAVVVLFSMAVLVGMLVFIIPRFAGIFEVAGGTVPATMQLLIGLSALLRGYWWAILLVLAVVVIAGLQAWRSRGAREASQRVFVRLPILGSLTLLTNFTRMARTMAILMRNGVHILQTVAIGARVLQNTVLRHSVATVSAELRQGEKLAQALGRSPYVPQLMLRMIAIGEETGSVDQMLERVADRFETDLRRKIRRTLSLLEPAVIVFLGLFIGLVVVSMFLAIMEMQGGY